MDSAITPLTGSATVAALLLAAAIAALGQRTSGLVGVLVRTATLALAGAAGWLVILAITRPELDPRLIVPGAALAGLSCGLVAPALAAVTLPSSIVFTFLWSALVYSPVAVALFSIDDGLLGAGLRTLDLGGALPVLLTSGCAILVLRQLGLRGRRGVGVRSRGRAGFSVELALLGLAWVLWIVWLFGLELVIDDATPRIALNTVIAPALSALGFWLVQIVRRVAHSVSGMTAAVISGLAAITAGCAYLNSVGAAITGAIAGTFTAAIVYTRRARPDDPLRLLAWSLVAGSSLGVILLGVLATRSGLIFTGQPEVLVAQLASVALVSAYSTALSLALGLGVRALDARLRDRAPTRGR